jgi:hypothetical protein
MECVEDYFAIWYINGQGSVRYVHGSFDETFPLDKPYNTGDGSPYGKTTTHHNAREWC